MFFVKKEEQLMALSVAIVVVSDSSGAPAPGVPVTWTEVNNSAVFNHVTDARGVANSIISPIGTYVVQAGAAAPQTVNVMPPYTLTVVQLP